MLRLRVSVSDVRYFTVSFSIPLLWFLTHVSENAEFRFNPMIGPAISEIESIITSLIYL